VRFAAGYVALCAGLSLALLGSKPVLSTAGSGLALAFAAALCLELTLTAEPFVRGLSYATSEAPRRLLAPAPLPSRASDPVILKNRRSFREVPLALASATANGLDYLQPVGSDQCWGAPIPCIPGGLKPGVALRDSSRGLRGGFVPEPAHLRAELND